MQAGAVVHLRREEARPDARLHRAQPISQAHYKATSRLPCSRSPSSKDSPLPAFWLAHLISRADSDDRAQVAALLTGKIVGLHPVGWGGSNGGYDRSVER